MAKTNDPHPSSFLAFACLANEWLADVIRGIPFWAEITPDDFPEIRETLDGASRLRFHTFWQTLRFEALVDGERARLLATGLPGRRIRMPETNRYICENILRVLRTETQNWKPPEPCMHFDQDGLWHPRRRTVTSMIVGAHVALRGNNRANTARCLNRGISRTDRVYGTDPSNVRNALETFVRRRLTASSWPSLVAPLVFQFSIADKLWRRAEEDPVLRWLPPSERAVTLVDRGKLLDWYREALESTAVPELTMRDCVGLAVVMQPYIQKLLAKRAA